jgi:SAM-dependent methyltransferase
MLDDSTRYGTWAAVDYTTHTYSRYEYSSAVDTAKKNLEAFKAFTTMDVTPVRRALDVGTATCRYPRMLAALGVWSVGVDICAAGYSIIRAAGSQFARFLKASGECLPFGDQQFDLITMMMGTLNHVGYVARRRLILEAFRLLKARGQLIISIWDTSCDHQSFLTIYDAPERHALSLLPCEPDQVEALGRTCGFNLVESSGFCYLPDESLSLVAILSDTPAGLQALAAADRPIGPHVGTAAQMWLIRFEKCE